MPGIEGTLAGRRRRTARRTRFCRQLSHEEFLAACLEREVAARAANGGELRIRAARFPARKSLDEFDFDHQRSLRRDVVAHLGALDFVAARDNVVFLGPPGTGKTHLAIGLSIRACHAGHRVVFATAAEWSTASPSPTATAGSTTSSTARPLPAHRHRRSRLHPLRTRSRQPVLPAHLRPLRTRSVIVTSNKPFGRWRDYGDDTVAAAMIDRLVHHAEVIALKGDSYRLKDRDLGRVPTDNSD